jgi:hypothetical protein
MANHIINDLGETVLAVGAPGSRARFRVEHPSLIKQAHFFLFDNDHNNLIFKDGCAIGVIVCTSEGWCAERFNSHDWILPAEYLGDDGILKLAEALEECGYKVWFGHRYADRIENLAKWLYEQARQS